MTVKDFIEELKCYTNDDDLKILIYCEKDDTWYSPDLKLITNDNYIKGKMGVQQEPLPDIFLTI